MLFCLSFPFQEPAPLLTLESAFREVLRSHPRIKSVRHELSAKLQAIKGARALTAPSILLSPGLTSFSGTTEELLALQPLELHGTRSARTALALAELHLAQAEAATTLLTLTQEVRLALVAREQALVHQQLAETQIRDTKRLEELAKKQVDLGTRPGIDLETLALETLRMENLRTQAVSGVKSTETALRLLLGYPEGSAVPTLAPLPLPQEPPAIETLLSAALMLRPELKQATAEQESLQAQQKRLQAEGKPDIAPMIRIGSLFRGIPPGSTGNGAGVGVAISLPLDHGSRRAQQAGLQERLAGHQSYRADITRQIEGEVREAVERLVTTKTILVRYETEARPRAERLLRASRIGFEEGKTSVLAVIEAQRTYRLIESETLQARYDVLRAAAALDMARGLSLLPLPEVQP